MKALVGRNFLRIFHILCLFSTLVLVIWCVHEYNQDHDLSEIGFKRFHEAKDDIYPSITICTSEPFLRSKYIPYLGNNFNFTFFNHTSAYGIQEPSVLLAYKQLLDGNIVTENKYKHMHGKTLEFDYDDMSMSFKELISEVYLTFPLEQNYLDVMNYHFEGDELLADPVMVERLTNESLFWHSNQIDRIKSLKYYVSVREAHRKCWTVDIPYVQDRSIRQLYMKFNTSIQNIDKIGINLYFFYLTYPNQLLGAYSGNKIALGNERAEVCYVLELRVGPLITLRRRNKKSSPCNQDWRNHDLKRQKQAIEKVGCVPVNWKIDSTFPNCTTVKQHQMIRMEINKNNGFMPPCRSIERILKKSEGKSGWRMCIRDQFFKLRLFLDQESHYEEIVLVPAYSTQSLIGNAGT